MFHQGGRPMNAPTTQIAKTITNIALAKYVLKYTNCLHKQGTVLAVNKRPHEIREVFYHDISMRINEDFSFYRLYHGIYATICSRRTPAKACLLKLYFLLQFSKALSNRQYHRFSFRVNQDIFCHSMTPCP